MPGHGIQARVASTSPHQRGHAMSESWNAPQREITPPAVALSRRRWLRWAVAGLGLGAIAGRGLYRRFRPGTREEVLDTQQEHPPRIDLYPAKLNAQFKDPGRPLTDEESAARYTNFY